MKDFAESFYKGTTWKECRKNYLKSVGGLCEDCLKKGIYKPAVIVHHKIVLNPQNIHTPEVSLNFANLKAVCRDCHALAHQSYRPYYIDEYGRVIIKELEEN